MNTIDSNPARGLVPLSVVILTFNEERNITRCIESVQWASDILVIDSGSTDQTCKLATALGARCLTRKFDNFAAQRNFALENGELRHEWVLHLDADEEASAELREELTRMLASGVPRDGYRVCEKLIFMGRWLKHSGMYPRYQVRFGSRDRLRFEMRGHGQREMLAPAAVGVLQHPLIHHNFSKGISDWMSKHARYARDEAHEQPGARNAISLSSATLRDKVERRRALKELSRRLPMRPLARFVYVYVFRLGFLDGRIGFTYAMLMATYQWMIDLNIQEQRSEPQAQKPVMAR